MSYSSGEFKQIEILLDIGERLEEENAKLKEKILMQEKKYTYDYPMFSLAVDIAVVDLTNTLLLIRRGGDVNTGKLAFCGGFVDINETTKDAAIRELKEETNLELTSEDFIERSELVLDDVNRDQRGRVVSVVYIVYLNDRFSKYNLKAGDDATSLEFYSIHNDDVKNELAFDHHKIWDYVWSYL